MCSPGGQDAAANILMKSTRASGAVSVAFVLVAASRAISHASVVTRVSRSMILFMRLSLSVNKRNFLFEQPICLWQRTLTFKTPPCNNLRLALMQLSKTEEKMVLLVWTRR